MRHCHRTFAPHHSPSPDESLQTVFTCQHRETLCLSYARQPVDLLTVSDFSGDPAELDQRKVAVISGRVHPGETNASWMMHGLMHAVTADTPAACALRRNLVLR